jgi:hypothetical protein
VIAAEPRSSDSRSGHTRMPVQRWQPSGPPRRHVQPGVDVGSSDADRPQGMPDAATRRAGPARDQPHHGGVKGLEVSLSDLLEDQLVERQIRYRTPQPRVLLLQIIQAPDLVNLQTAILATPAVATLLLQPKTTTDHTDPRALRQTHLGLTQKTNILYWRLSLPAHLFLLLWSSDQPGSLSQHGPVLWEQVSGRPSAPAKNSLNAAMP